MIGRLAEISKWCQFDGNAWASPVGEGHSGWEELPYWLKGYGDLGCVLQNKKLIRETRKWIDAVLASQEADGWFGPRKLKTSLEGNPDLWPHMVMLNVLQSFYEYTGDERVLPFIGNYCKWVQSGGTETWPEFEVFPTTPWNYGLELNVENPAKSFEVRLSPGPIPRNPFTPETAPIKINARARRIPEWKQDQFGLAGKLQGSPVKSEAPTETVSLIPMGAARLRISAFPVIGHGPEAHEWNEP